MFLHENFFKLDTVKFSLIDSPAMKNKNIRFFFCLSLRNGKTTVLFIFPFTILQINQNCIFLQTKTLKYGAFLKSMFFVWLRPPSLHFRENILNSIVVFYRIINILVKSYSFPRSSRHSRYVFD